MKVGDRFIDFDLDLEMKIVSIVDTGIKCIPVRENFLECTDFEYYCLLNQYGKKYNDLEYIESAILSYEDDRLK